MVHRSKPTSKVVVTGAAGFIGSHLVDALLATDTTVVGFDNFDPWYNPAIKLANLDMARDHPRFRLVTATLGDPDVDLHNLFTAADVIYHLAGRPGVQTSWGHQFKETVDSNLTATQAVFEAALSAGVQRVVFASSSSVYGECNGPGHPPQSNPPQSSPSVGVASRPIAPISPYGVTKAAAEQLASVYVKRGLDIISLRYFTVYGPRQRPDMAIHRLLEATYENGLPFTKRGSGNQRRAFTHVSDIVSATIAAGHSPLPAGDIFDVGGSSMISVNQLIDIIENLTGRAVDLVQIPLPAGDPALVTPNTGPTVQKLGWAPQVGIEAGLADQYAANRNNSNQTKATASRYPMASR